MPHKDPDVRRAYKREYQKKWARRNPEKVSEITGRYKERNREKIAEQRSHKTNPSRKAYHIKYRYGLDPEQHEALLAKGCALCGGEARVVDHCHATNKVRAALCYRCNMGLGYFLDNPALLEKAAAYVRQHAQLQLSEAAA